MHVPRAPILASISFHSLSKLQANDGSRLEDGSRAFSLTALPGLGTSSRSSDTGLRSHSSPERDPSWSR